MTDAAAFKGTIGALRTIGGRKVIAVTVEVPIEHQSVVAKIAEHGAWVAVARLAAGDAPATPEKPKRSWSELSVGEQAGIRCGEPAFRRYVAERVRDKFQVGFDESDLTNAGAAGRVAMGLRDLFGVETRADIPRDKWESFDNDYQHWLRT